MPLLVDQVGAFAGKVELGLHLVFGDLGLALDGEGAAFVEGAVGLSLELLEERGAQGGFDALVGAKAQQARVDDGHAGGAQLLVTGEGSGEQGADPVERSADSVGERHPSDRRGQGGVGDAGDGFVDLPQPLRVGPGLARVQAEVVVFGGGFGVLDVVGDGDLRVDVLLVGGRGLHEEAVGAVGGGHFREGAAPSSQPEGLADAGSKRASGADLDDVVSGAALVANEEGVVVKSSHDGSLVVWSPTCLCHYDDKPSQQLMSTRHK